VIAISARPYGQRAVLKFAQYTGAASIAGRFTPGTFTNQITKQFREPRLLIITDPRTDAQVRCCATRLVTALLSVALCSCSVMSRCHAWARRRAHNAARSVAQRGERCDAAPWADAVD
jgi:hypothetical protein